MAKVVSKAERLNVSSQHKLFRDSIGELRVKLLL